MRRPAEDEDDGEEGDVKSFPEPPWILHPVVKNSVKLTGNKNSPKNLSYWNQTFQYSVQMAQKLTKRKRPLQN